MRKAASLAGGDRDADLQTPPRERHWAIRNAGGLLAAVYLTVAVLGALLARWIAPYDPLATDILANLLPPGSSFDGQPSYVLGTDMLGRDVLSGIIYGSRISLIVGFVTVFGAGVLGTVIGIVSGYYKGWLDEVLMRLVDIQLAFPFILLAILMMYVLGQGLANVIIVLIVATWPIYARVARAEALHLSASEFVTAARGVGAGTPRILLRHIFPNAMTPLIVVAAFSVPQMIIYEAALSFLGVGLPSSELSWGTMLATGRDYLTQAWWIATFPGVAIVCTILSINVLSELLRQRLDPSHRNQ